MGSEELTLQKIDLICTEFEAGWSSQLPLQSLVDLALSHARPGTDSFFELYVELAQIDLENRWKYFAIVTEAEFEDTAGDNTARVRNNKADGGVPPTSLDYLPVDFFEGVAESIKNTLLECELKSRLKFGDVPSLIDFEIPPGSWQNFQRLMPIVVVTQDGQSTFSHPFWNRLFVGRQAVSDPAPICLVYEPQQKLIVSGLHDTTISREQLELQLISGSIGKLHNTSQNRHFAFEKNRVIAPGCDLFVRLPLTIHLGSIKILFCRVSTKE